MEIKILDAMDSGGDIQYFYDFVYGKCYDIEDLVLCNVVLKNGSSGVIQYAGPIKGKLETCSWFGIGLYEPNGENDGFMCGNRYFHCKTNHGLFVTPAQIDKIIYKSFEERYNISMQ